MRSGYLNSQGADTVIFDHVSVQAEDVYELRRELSNLLDKQKESVLGSFLEELIFELDAWVEEHPPEEPEVVDWKVTCSEENAVKFSDWIDHRGGLALWESANLGNSGAGWTTPARQEDGISTAPPTWEAKKNPSHIITNPDHVCVSIDKEVDRFPVAIRAGSGLQYECTAGSTKKIELALERAGEGSYYEFDYYTQEAVIMAPKKRMSLTAWFARDDDEL